MGILLSYNVLTCLLTIYHVKIFKKENGRNPKTDTKKTISSPRNHILEAFTTKKENKELLFEVYKMAI